MKINYRKMFEESTGKKHKVETISKRENAHCYLPSWEYTDWLENEIDKIKDAQKIKEEAQQEAIIACHTCGAACYIGGDDKEGTHYFIPLAPFEKSQD